MGFPQNHLNSQTSSMTVLANWINVIVSFIKPTNAYESFGSALGVWVTSKAHNPLVVGSIPTVRHHYSSFSHVAQWQSSVKSYNPYRHHSLLFFFLRAYQSKDEIRNYKELIHRNQVWHAASKFLLSSSSCLHSFMI